MKLLRKCISELFHWEHSSSQQILALKLREGFLVKVEGIMKAYMYATLFDDLTKMGESVHLGFNLVVASRQFASNR